MSEKNPACGKCAMPPYEAFCRSEKGVAPPFCPTLRNMGLARKVLEETSPEDREMARLAGVQEHMGYVRPSAPMPAKPRIVEIVEFSRRMGYKKLALIFCGAVRKEAGVVQEILETNGFEVASFMCKVGRVPKSAFGITQEEHLNPAQAVETACNPMLQAALANQEQVDFAILMGLCVGHDSLALKHLEAPATVFAVKDRLLGHNPLAAIYMYDSLYRYLKKPLP